MPISQGAGGQSAWATSFRSSKTTVRSVTSAASETLLCTKNELRMGCSIYNDSTQVLYLKCGPQVTSSSFTVQMASESYFEVPFGFRGDIYGVWASANGSAMVTEFT